MPLSCPQAFEHPKQTVLTLDGTVCLGFKKVKWGKDVSYIYLEGPMKYAYHTGDAVIGPLE